MCVQPVAWPEPDPPIAAAIAAKYPGKRPRPLAVQVRDRLGQWLADEEFASAFGIRGRPGWSPSRLALVTVLQRAEKLTGRQAAEAVRTRIGWQYLLGLSLDDPGFDHTVLAEFRGKVADAGLEQVALDALLARLAAGGLVKAGGKQRTDSTHVVAAVAALNRLELAGEAVRAALEALATAHPDWLAQRICVADWNRRYGTPMTSWRPPQSEARRDELAIACARDGYALLEAVCDPSAPPWLRELPAVDVLRRVLVQNYTRTITAAGREVIKRREKEPEGDGLPPGHARIASPYDTDARWGVKREEFWLGCKLHVTETCDDPPPCTCRPASAAGQAAAGSAGEGAQDRGHDKGCAHLVFPNLITHVATTGATVTDNQMTTAICKDLARKNLAPGRSYPDSGYLSAAVVVPALTTWGIALTGPLLAGTSAQARAGAGYARAASPPTTTPRRSPARKARHQRPGRRAPSAARTRSWPPSHPATAAPAPPAACAPPAAGNDGSSPCCPATWPKPRPPPAPRKTRSPSRPTTPAAPASRAPCTRPPATAPAAPATAACRKPASTTCTWPPPSTCSAWKHSGPAHRWTGSGPATWPDSNSASPHRTRINE